jgi:hypothetical protein
MLLILSSVSPAEIDHLDFQICGQDIYYSFKRYRFGVTDIFAVIIIIEKRLNEIGVDSTV